MIIYVDWVDLCWKSTLIRKIEEIFSNKYKKISVFKTDMNRLPRNNQSEEELAFKKVDIWNFYNEQLDKAITMLQEDKDQLIILDRFFMSEIVYGKVMRWYTFKDNEQVKKLYEQLLEKIRYIESELWWFAILYLSDEISSIMSRFNKVWDDYLSKEDQFIAIMNEFEKEIDELQSSEIITFKINVFKSNIYWWDIIEKLYFKDYNYIRQR